MDWIGGTEWIEKSEYSYIQAKKNVSVRCPVPD